MVSLWAKMRKIYIVPNVVTTANMFCGFYSVVLSAQGQFLPAAWAIVAAAVFDMLDGRIARLARATSQFGVEYDSLSDLISFGMAPAFLAYQWALTPFGRLGWLIAFLFLACSGLRLARFNVNTAVIPKSHFQGVPTPMSANMISTFVIFNHSTGFPGANALIKREALVLMLALALSVLMVSTMRFPSFKELNWRSRSSFGYLLIAVLMLVLVAVKPEVTLFLLGATYLTLSLVWNCVCLMRGATSE